MSFKNRIKRSFEGENHKTNGFFEKEAWSAAGGFERPNKANMAAYLQIGGVVLVIIGLIVGSIYFWTKANNEISEVAQIKKITNNNPWYAVKLLDGDIIYGKITDINTDPIVIDSVYYNYDQKKSENEAQKRSVSENGDLRLLKRGNETHGPDGKLQVFRAQIVYMENLRADSKVLRVIEENEK